MHLYPWRAGFAESQSPGRKRIMNGFVCALEQRNPEELRKYPKADLHNHFVLGGSRRFLYQVTGKKIEPLTDALSSMDEMDQWSQKYIGQNFNSTGMSGVDVTINSDDVLIFDSDVSKEYLRLYESQCLTAEELDDIRKNGLKEMTLQK